MNDTYLRKLPPDPFVQLSSVFELIRVRLHVVHWKSAISLLLLSRHGTGALTMKIKAIVLLFDGVHEFIISLASGGPDLVLQRSIWVGVGG